MEKEKAEVLATLIDGEAWHSGGDIWLVLKRTSDGRVVSISDEVIIEYVSEEAFEQNEISGSIEFVSSFIVVFPIRHKEGHRGKQLTKANSI